MPSEGNKMQLNKEEYKNFKQIVNIFYNEEIEGINEEKEKIKKEGKIGRASCRERVCQYV